MSLFTEASLVMIPSGVKDGKLYSIKPDDGVGDFTFTRGSNLAATRVDENGLIEKGRENLLLRSNAFTTSPWVVFSATLTSGQTGYDGSSDAWLLTKTGSFGRITQDKPTSGVVTISFYAKANTSNWVRLYAANANSNFYFDLLNGVVGTNTNNVDTNIELIANGWYRCSATISSANTSIIIYVADADNDASGTSGSIYIQDAQVELGLVATDYIETGATTEQAGILENLPRLDYTDSSCPSLLLEPTRSNLVPESEPFTGGQWLLSAGGSITSNQAISPEGVQNACKVQGTASGSFIYDVLTLTPSTNYTTSLYVKNIDSVQTQFLAANEQEYDINWDGAEILSVSTDVSYQSLANGWYRVWITKPSNPDGQYITRFYPSNSTNSVYLYGYQVELGSYPTSYIPTYGTSVTRSADNCFGAGDATTFNDNEGCVFLDLKGFIDAETGNRHVSLSDGSIDNALIFYFDASGFLGITNRGSSSSSQVLYKNYDVSQQIKLALNYGDSTGDYKLYINGSSVALEGAFSAKIMTGLNEFEFRYANDSLPFKGTVNKAIYFPTALTDSELEALTTI